MSKIDWGSIRQEKTIKETEQGPFGAILTEKQILEWFPDTELPENSERWKKLTEFFDNTTENLKDILDISDISLELNVQYMYSLAGVEKLEDKQYRLFVNAHSISLLAKLIGQLENASQLHDGGKFARENIGKFVLQEIYSLAHEFFHIRQNIYQPVVSQANLEINLQKARAELAMSKVNEAPIDIREQYKDFVKAKLDEAEKAYQDSIGEKAAEAFSIRMLKEIKQQLVRKQSAGEAIAELESLILQSIDKEIEENLNKLSNRKKLRTTLF